MFICAANLSLFQSKIARIIFEWSEKISLFEMRMDSLEIDFTYKSQKYTDALNCYGPPKMLILVFIKFRETQE